MPAACKNLVPINIVGAWEVDCPSPTCVPRLCSLTVTKLLILKELSEELASLVVAVRIAGSQFVLRSDDILLPPRIPMKTDLALTFSLKYPHSIKRGANKLHIMLQRKVPCENRTKLGYQTLAMGTIDMAEVMQGAHGDGQVLSLHSTIREAWRHVAEVSMSSLSSQPIDVIHSTQEAKSRAQDSKIECKTILEQEASHDPGNKQDQDEEDFNMDELKRQDEERARSASMTRQQEAKRKVGVWLHQVEVWKKDPEREEMSLEDIPDVEEDLDQLYASLDNLDASSP